MLWLLASTSVIGEQEKGVFQRRVILVNELCLCMCGEGDPRLHQSSIPWPAVVARSLRYLIQRRLPPILSFRVRRSPVPTPTCPKEIDSKAMCNIAVRGLGPGKEGSKALLLISDRMNNVLTRERLALVPRSEDIGQQSSA